MQFKITLLSSGVLKKYGLAYGRFYNLALWGLRIYTSGNRGLTRRIWIWLLFSQYHTICRYSARLDTYFSYTLAAREKKKQSHHRQLESSLGDIKRSAPPLLY